MNPTLNPNLKSFWKTRTLPGGYPVKFRTLYGGRMSSKSHDAAGVAIARANFMSQRFLCLRMYQNRIEDSVYRLLCDKISYFGLSGRFRVYKDAIEHRYNDSLFRFYGCARNIDEIKSFEGADVLWMEEGHNITQKMFVTLRPTVMRNQGAEFWITFNPDLMEDYAYQRFVVNPPKGTLTRLINYPENPFLSRDALLDIEAEFEEDPEEAAHIYLGVPRTSNDKAIIKLSWLNACVDSHKKLGLEEEMSGPKNAGYDVADDGGDRNSVTGFNGRIANYLDVWKAKEDELVESAMRAWSFMDVAKGKAPAGRFMYDGHGVGAHTGSTLKAAGFESGYFKFLYGGGVIKPDDEYSPGILIKEKFENLKIQAWDDVAISARKTYNAIQKGKRYPANELLSIDSEAIGDNERQTLINELVTPHRIFSRNSKEMVERKEDIKKRLGRSHDLADSFVMGACPHLVELPAMGFLDMTW